MVMQAVVTDDTGATAGRDGLDSPTKATDDGDGGELIKLTAKQKDETSPKVLGPMPHKDAFGGAVLRLKKTAWVERYMCVMRDL